jgi:phage terminase large subunit-like protein
VFFPKESPWLPDLEAEVFAFPRGRHDDQVDSISQALGYKIPSLLWTDASLKGLSDFTNAQYRDAMFGRLAGRPW